MEELGSRKRSRDDLNDIDFISSPEVKRIKEDLFGNSDDGGEFFLSNEKLESFMKSFQDEISTTRNDVPMPDSGEFQPEMGFLLEASDNELGIPPLNGELEEEEKRTKQVRVESAELYGLSDGDIWRFDSEIPSFDPLDFGEGNIDRNYNDDFLVLDGLFDYSDMDLGFSDLTWRPEILPAK